jgi:hypothetical protein
LEDDDLDAIAREIYRIFAGMEYAYQDNPDVLLPGQGDEIVDLQGVFSRYEDIGDGNGDNNAVYWAIWRAEDETLVIRRWR